MAAVLAIHAVLGLGLLTFGRPLGRWAVLVGALGPLTAVLWWLAHIGTVVDGGVIVEHASWVPLLDLGVDLRFDGFAALMVAIVSGIGVAVFAYAGPYFGADHEGLGRISGLLTLFSGAMLGVVLADNLILLYGFWELTSITSYLLIGDRHRDPAARAAANQAILVTGAGGLVMLFGFVLLGTAGGTYQLSALLADPPTGAVVTTALVLIAIGAFTKSAQVPFHAWLPGAMVAPTPISAYLHSATMVKAGVYLVARLAPAFAVVATGWRPLTLTVGLASMVVGGLLALRQHDLKLLLAYGTISQLGFMIVLFGAGTPAATAAGCAVILAHALFKAALFMVVGVIDHGTGTRDIREIPRLHGSWRVTKAVGVVAAASMAGVPLTFGFVAKELGFDAFTGTPFADAGLVLGVLVAASALTAAYALRFVVGMYGVRATPPAADAPRAVPVHAPSKAFVAPAAVLALATLLFGIAPGLLDTLLSAASAALDAAATSMHLAVWHGINTALILSVVAIAAGVLCFVLVWRLDGTRSSTDRAPLGNRAFDGAVAGLTRFAERVTGVVQSGSMPIYIGVILTTAVVVPGAALLFSPATRHWVIADTWIQLPIVAVLIASALGAAAVRHRLSAALLLGVVGYSMTALFVVQGAPDLALTQAAIETLTTILFVLALRHLPRRFERRSTTATRALRIVVSIGVAAFVFAFAATATNHPLERTVSSEMIARAEPEAHGRNVVNVILVDFRGLDTLGEMTVIAVAAIGAVALARAGRRPRPAPVAMSQGPGGTMRYAFVDVVVRILVYVALVVSVYLLVAGHNQPGGGFVGGLVAGTAVALRYVAGGLDEVRRMARARPWTILGIGVLISAVTATVPVLLGKPLLDVAHIDVHVPLLGDVGLSSSLPFDVGVYLAVVGLVFMVFEAFGGDDAPEALP
jgi:multicomponent Na+:H+ antiporter subunit A